LFFGQRFLPVIDVTPELLQQQLSRHQIRPHRLQGVVHQRQLTQDFADVLRCLRRRPGGEAEDVLFAIPMHAQGLRQRQALIVLGVNVAELGRLFFVGKLGEDFFAVGHHLAQVKTRQLHRVAYVDKLVDYFLDFFSSAVVVVDVHVLLHDLDEPLVNSSECFHCTVGGDRR
jgi:hypothetical protein